MPKLNVRNSTDEAFNAFWAVIVNRYPHAVTGDLSPGATIALQMAAEDAVYEWIVSNVPKQFRK